jgi:MYXO-CTERM domain-containing protein
VWYAYATVDLSVPGTPADDFVLQPAVRLTDNTTGTGVNGSVNYIYDGAGVNVPEDTIEKGQAAAARPNIQMVGTTTIIAYEEKKGSTGLDEGKFIRYHAFPFDAPPATAEGKAGCIISDPAKNARRVRFLTQSPADAGAGGIHIAVFWKEGIYDKGGPSDIVVRRGMGGLQPASMVPAVDPNCATSDYATAIALTSARAENISSNTPTATTANLADDTELKYTENALAHRGVLRGPDLWIGYNYTSDLVKLWAQLDNYNFWIRKFTAGGGWENPKNVTNVADRRMNVREPRIFGTPKSNGTLCPTDPTFCQDPKIVYLAWGTQVNASPFDPAGAQDLGEYVTVSQDGGATFATPVKLSVVQGVLWGDDESAYESQNVTRPDGKRFHSVWNQKTLATGATVAEYTSGDVSGTADPVTPAPSPVAPVSGKSGGCSAGTGKAPLDPTLPVLALLALLGLGMRRARRR